MIWSLVDLFSKGMDREVPAFRSEHIIPDVDRVVLNLGCGAKTFEGCVNMDGNSPFADVIWQAGDPLPYADKTVDEIIAFHFLEHLPPNVVLMVLQEAQRVLVPYGVMNIVVPYGVSDCALQDLDHKSRFIEDTWKNTFMNPYYEKGAWEFDIGPNMIMGLNHRNLVLCTQLVRR